MRAGNQLIIEGKNTVGDPTIFAFNLEGFSKKFDILP